MSAYRGWLIDTTPIGWVATGPNYDASHEDGEWVDNGEKVEAKALECLKADIDAWIDLGERQ